MPGPRAGFQKWLELTPEQEAKLKDMRAARQEMDKGFFEKLDKMRQDLRKAMQDPKADQKKIEGLVDEMHRAKAEQMKSHLKFRKEMEKILTPEQLDKFKNARERMGNWHRGGRFMRRHPGARGMMGPENFGFRGARYPRHRDFGPGWDL